MSKIKVNSLEGVGASTPAISIDNASGTCTANITNNLSNRNLIINGAMEVSQRGTSSTSTGYGTVDRFLTYHANTDEAPTYAQVDVASGTTPYTLGFRKAFKITNGNQTSGAGAGDIIEFGQKLEAQDIAQSGWNYLSASSNITLSFWVKSSVAQNFYGFFRTRDGTGYSYPFSTGSLSADTWTKVTKTISGNSNLQIDNNNESGLELYIAQFYGTNYTNNSRSLDSWAAHADASHFPDMTATWYEADNATFEVTGVQLEVSDYATSFEHRSFSQELALCTRYCQVFTSAATDKRVNFSSVFVHGNGGGIYIMVGLSPMRSAPSVTVDGTFVANVLTGGWSGVALSSFSAEFTSNSDNYGKTFGFDGLMSAVLASNQTIGKTGNIYSNSGFGQFIFSAEL